MKWVLYLVAGGNAPYELHQWHHNYGVHKVPAGDRALSGSRECLVRRHFATLLLRYCTRTLQGHCLKTSVGSQEACRGRCCSS